MIMSSETVHWAGFHPIDSRSIAKTLPANLDLAFQKGVRMLQKKS